MQSSEYMHAKSDSGAHNSGWGRICYNTCKGHWYGTVDADVVCLGAPCGHRAGAYADRSLRI